MMKYLYLSGYPQIFLSMTGLRVEEFDALVDDVRPLFAAAEVERLSRPDWQRAMGGGVAAELSMRDQVLLSVSHRRQDPRQDILGYFFGVSQASVSRLLQRVLPLLEAAGRDRMRLPDPGRQGRRHLDNLLAARPQLMGVIDSFEHKVQRPKNADERDAWYTGKKKTHTLKSQTAVDEATGEIVYIPDRVPGPRPDLQLLEQSGRMGRLPQAVAGLGDCGYQASDKRPPNAYRPRKKPPGNDRPTQDVAYNTAFARRRIIVENSNARLRRYQRLSQTDRNHRQNHSQRVPAVAGLVNPPIRSRLLA